MNRFAAQTSKRQSRDELKSLRLAAATKKIARALKNFMLAIKK
jgi:hypothetical protein